MRTPVTKWSDDDGVALKHAWDWFALHANQRMQTFSLMLASVTLALAGYGVAIATANYFVAIVVASAGVVITLVFAGMDHRNRELIRAAEEALRPLQARLALAVDIPQVEFAAEVHRPTFRHLNFTSLIRALAIVLVTIFIAAIVAAVGLWVAWPGVAPEVSSILTPSPAACPGADTCN